MAKTWTLLTVSQYGHWGGGIQCEMPTADPRHPLVSLSVSMVTGVEVFSVKCLQQILDIHWYQHVMSLM